MTAHPNSSKHRRLAQRKVTARWIAVLLIVASQLLMVVGLSRAAGFSEGLAAMLLSGILLVPGALLGAWAGRADTRRRRDRP